MRAVAADLGRNGLDWKVIVAGDAWASSDVIDLGAGQLLV